MEPSRSGVARGVGGRGTGRDGAYGSEATEAAIWGWVWVVKASERSTLGPSRRGRPRPRRFRAAGEGPLSLSLRGRDLLFVRSSPGAAPVRIALRLHHRPFSSRCETKAALATSSAASTVATETKHAGTRTFPYSRSTGFCRSRQPFLGT